VTANAGQSEKFGWGEIPNKPSHASELRTWVEPRATSSVGWNAAFSDVAAMTLVRGRRLLAICLLAMGITHAMAEAPADHVPGTTWGSVDPVRAGWSTDLLKQARSWSASIHSSAVMIVTHGRVIAEWGDTTKPMELASVRKSLLSALIGIAVARRQIDLDAEIGTLGIDDNAPSLTAEEKTATVRDLLEARSGIYHAALYETAGMAAQRPPRGSHPPGTFWYYNNWDFNTLAAIYLHATGTSVFDALDRDIAKPIGMQDYRPSDGVYFTGSASVYPAYPIRMSARDLARFALLYLRGGRWRHHQIVPAPWVRASTTPYSASGSGPGYGYLWWTGFLDPAEPASSVHLPKGSFFAWGAGGQYAVVIPPMDLVVVYRIDRDKVGYRETTLHELGRLLWLVLAAAHQPDVGPDTSLAAARGERLDGAALTARLSGATLLAPATPDSLALHARFGADGTFVTWQDDMSKPINTGTWTIRDGKYCGEIAHDIPRCFIVFADGTHLDFFGADGILQYDVMPAPTTP
jgi:CubicO group peptidase (beta-lactamase class C family)